MLLVRVASRSEAKLREFGLIVSSGAKACQRLDRSGTVPDALFESEGSGSQKLVQLRGVLTLREAVRDHVLRHNVRDRRSLAYHSAFPG